jgi:hypothetical protein
MCSPILSYLEEGCAYHLPHVRLSYKVTIKGQKRPRIIKSVGPVQLQLCKRQILLTGIAALLLSSAAAFELKDASYKGTVLVHFCPDLLGGKVENIEQYLWQYRQDNANSLFHSSIYRCNIYVDVPHSSVVFVFCIRN